MPSQSHLIYIGFCYKRVYLFLASCNQLVFKNAILDLWSGTKSSQSFKIAKIQMPDYSKHPYCHLNYLFEETSQRRMSFDEQSKLLQMKNCCRFQASVWLSSSNFGKTYVSTQVKNLNMVVKRGKIK